MISKEMKNTINEQITKEIFSAYLYLSMASFCDWKGYTGSANWFKKQAKEELEHAEKFYNYLQEQGERVIFEKIEKPESEFKSLKELFEKTLEHEKTVTASINNIVKLAQKENDIATFTFLQWFVSEQVEEEAHASEILTKLNIIGETGPALYMLDKELGARS